MFGLPRCLFGKRAETQCNIILIGLQTFRLRPLALYLKLQVGLDIMRGMGPFFPLFRLLCSSWTRCSYLGFKEFLLGRFLKGSDDFLMR